MLKQWALLQGAALAEGTLRALRRAVSKNRVPNDIEPGPAVPGLAAGPAGVYDKADKYGFVLRCQM